MQQEINPCVLKPSRALTSLPAWTLKPTTAGGVYKSGPDIQFLALWMKPYEILRTVWYAS
jgi:hypothetical protein